MESKKGSSEHIIPYSLGGAVVLKAMCKECNELIGQKIDIHVTNNSICKMVRYSLKIKGKKKKVPEPFGRGIIKDGTNREVLFRGYKPTFHPIIKTSNDGNLVNINCQSEEDGLTIMRKMLSRKGTKNLTSDEIRNRIMNSRFEKKVLLLK